LHGTGASFVEIATKQHSFSYARYLTCNPFDLNLGITVIQLHEFGVTQSKLREPAIQANPKSWKRPHCGLLQSVLARKVNVDLGGKFPLIL
jgi:hypothetical protein